MITNDELTLLKQSLQQRQERHLTPGGTVESTVNQQQRMKQMSQYRDGVKTMQSATKRFNQQMKSNFKGRVNEARNDNFPKEVPASDKAIAERTWTKNSIGYHEGKLNDASVKFRSATQRAFKTMDRSR